MTSCTMHDCPNKVVAKGLCMKHYRRLLRNGTTKLTPREQRICSVDGCNQPFESVDYCSRHYRKWKEYGNPHYEGYDVAKGKTCVLSLCTKEVRCKGLCSTHYASYISYQRRRPSYTLEGFLQWKEARMHDQSL